MKKDFKYVKFTIVNLITFSRVLGSVILPIIYFVKGIEWLGFFVIALFLTDFIDGKLSRFWKVESYLGGLLDSISDKLFAFVMLSILSYEYPSMLIVLLLEFVIFVVNTLSFSENKNVQTSKMGKVKAFALDISVSVMFLYTARILYEKYLGFTFNKFLERSEYPVCYVLVGIMIGMELLTISDYSKKRLKQVSYEKMPGKKLKSFKEIWEMLISREFYITNKDEPLKKFLYGDGE